MGTCSDKIAKMRTGDGPNLLIPSNHEKTEGIGIYKEGFPGIHVRHNCTYHSHSLQLMKEYMVSKVGIL